MLNYCSYLPVSNVNKCGMFCLQFFDFSKSIRLIEYVDFLISFVSTVVDWMHCVISFTIYLTVFDHFLIHMTHLLAVKFNANVFHILGDVLHTFDNLI